MVKKLCNHKGCNRPCMDGSEFCSKHQGDKPIWNFKPSDVRYSDPRWTALSKELRNNHPYCDRCHNYFLPSDLIVHHKNTKARDLEGTDDFYNVGNLEVLCRQCHLITIRRGE